MLLHKAIRKYGPDAFELVSEVRLLSVERMWQVESLFIELDIDDGKLYNVSRGGECPALCMKHNEETRDICGEHARRRWDGKRAKDLYPKEAFSTLSYKEARDMYGVPKTTWYRQRRND